MYTIKERLQAEIQEIKDSGLYKNERVITSPQGADITLADGRSVINFCANNYLGLSSHPKVIEAEYTWIWDVFCSIYLRNSGYSQNT